MEQWLDNLEKIESLPTSLAPLNEQMEQNCPQTWHTHFGTVTWGRKKKTKHLKPLCDGVFFFIFLMKNIKLIAKFKKLYSGQPYAHSLNLPLTFYYTLKKITNLSLFPPSYPSIRLSHFFGHNSKYIADICILFLSTPKTEFTWRTKQRWAFQAKETSYIRAMKHCIQVGGCSILRIAIVSIRLQLRVMMWGQPKMSIQSWPGFHCFAKCIGLGPLDSGEPSKGFKQGTDIIRFEF